MKKILTILVVLMSIASAFADSTLRWSNPASANGTFILDGVVVTNSSVSGGITITGPMTNTGTAIFTGELKAGTTNIIAGITTGITSGTNALAGDTATKLTAATNAVTGDTASKLTTGTNSLRGDIVVRYGLADTVVTNALRGDIVAAYGAADTVVTNTVMTDITNGIVISGESTFSNANTIVVASNITVGAFMNIVATRVSVANIPATSATVAVGELYTDVTTGTTHICVK